MAELSETPREAGQKGGGPQDGTVGFVVGSERQGTVREAQRGGHSPRR